MMMKKAGKQEERRERKIDLQIFPTILLKLNLWKLPYHNISWMDGGRNDYDVFE